MEKSGGMFLGETIQLLDDAAHTKEKLNGFCLAFRKWIKTVENQGLVQRSEELDTLKAWVCSASYALRTPKSSIKGWLAKRGQGFGKKLSIVQIRWAVLDPPNLLYYVDESQTTLKGILYLDRCKFTREGPWFTLFNSNTNDDGDWINPLNKSKMKYTWGIPRDRYRGGDADKLLDMWNTSITSAMKASRALRKLLALQKSFSGAKNLVAYYDHLQTLSRWTDGQSSSWQFKIPISWLRNHKHDAELVLQDEMRSCPAIDSSSGKSANFDRRRMSTQTLNEVELQDLHSQLGYVQDKRKIRYSVTNMRQVRKDMPRDSMVINGARHVGVSGDRAVGLVFQCILRVIANSHDESTLSRMRLLRGGSVRGLSADDRLRALRLARRVVLGSSRTISGGETWDAADFLCRNRRVAHMVPRSETASPINIVVKPYSEELVKATKSALAGFPIVLVWTDMWYSVQAISSSNSSLEIARVKTRFQRQFVCHSDGRSGPLESNFPDVSSATAMRSVKQKWSRLAHNDASLQCFDIFSEGVVAIEVCANVSGDTRRSVDKILERSRSSKTLSMNLSNIDLTEAASRAPTETRDEAPSGHIAMAPKPPPLPKRRPRRGT